MRIEKKKQKPGSLGYNVEARDSHVNNEKVWQAEAGKYVKQ